MTKKKKNRLGKRKKKRDSFLLVNIKWFFTFQTACTVCDKEKINEQKLKLFNLII